MLKKVLLAIAGAFAVVLIVVLGLAATKPATFRVERRTIISAPPQAVFPNIDDFRRWAAWSPWEKLDPNMKKTYGDVPRGVGATYAWSGSGDVGEGKMTVLESRPYERIAIRLEFLKPFASTNSTVYTLKPVSDGTEVTWAMEGPNTFAGKIISVFTDMDSMIGKDFEKGLADLKRVSETGATTAAN